MTVAETQERCKALLRRVPPDVLVMAVLLAASSASFGLGYLAGESGAGASRVTIEIAPELEAREDREGRRAGEGEGESGGAYVASKNGTKYYLPTCAGAERINEENRVWFASVAEAQAAGYGPAANCKGL